MPEINPLTNNQIFLKKIAENTGSNYDTGDVSEINPLTIDQIFLKEIAANTEGQSGDITELEEKVTANAEAIEAMVNVLGAKNICKYPYTDTTKTVTGVTYTDNGDGTITINGGNIGSSWATFALENVLDGDNGFKVGDIFKSAGDYTISVGDDFDDENIHVDFAIISSPAIIKTIGSGEEYPITITDAMMSYALYFNIGVKAGYNIATPVTIKPMIRPAGTDATYVPYAMTNKELTDAVNRGSVSVAVTTSMTFGQALSLLYNSIDISKVSIYSKIVMFGSSYTVRYLAGNLISFTSVSASGVSEIQLKSSPAYIETVFASQTYSADKTNEMCWYNTTLTLYY